MESDLLRNLRGVVGVKDALSDAPDWSAGGEVHNWCNHVGEGAKSIWASLTPEQRAALVLDADERASGEHWD